MRLFVPCVAFILFVFGLALTADRNQIVASPEVVNLPNGDDCCDGECDCCEKCPCGKDVSSPSDAEDLSSHIGKLVTRSSKPGVWRVVDAWRDDSGELMYRYQLEQSTAANSCPGGVCPQPMGTYDGTSGWTYPGDIVDHLMSDPKHFVPAEQIIGKTKDELEAMHDSLHEGGQALRLQSNNCPGGVCPQPSVQRRGLFRWRR